MPSYRPVALVLGAIVCMLVALFAVRIGGYPFGTSLDDTGDCLRSEMEPSIGGPYRYPEVRVHGDRTPVPLGSVAAVAAIVVPVARSRARPTAV